MPTKQILSFIAGVSVLFSLAACGEMENGQQAFDRGSKLLNEGQYDEAIQAFDKAIALDPGSAHAYSLRGSAHSDRNDQEKAIADITKAIELSKESGDQALLAEFYFNRALAQSRAQHYKEGIADFDSAIAINPNDPDYYNSRARARFYAGDAAASLKDAEEALSLNQEKDERRARSLFARGSAELKMGKTTEAIADLNEASALDKKNATLLHELSLAYAKDAKAAEAEAAEKKAKALGYKGQDGFSFR